MRAIRAASVALLAAATVVVTAPAAPAEEGDDGNHGITSFGFSVTPATVAPGGTVTLTSDGCEAPSVTVTAGTFDTVTLTGGKPGTATVDLDAEPGTQDEIAFDCGGERGTTKLTVARGDTGGNRPEHEDVLPPEAQKGVKAGYGTASSPSDGLGAAEVVTGALLIAGALAAAVTLTRRRA